MNLQEIREQLRRECGSPTTSDVSDAELNTCINNAYRDIGLRYKHHNARRRCKFQTIVGTSQYVLPADCGVVRYIKNLTNGKRVVKLDESKVAGMGTIVDGPVTNYTREIDYIRLFPTPNAAEIIEIYYDQLLSDLQLDADRPVMLISWHIGIVKLARWYYFDGIRSYGEANLALNSFNQWVSTKPSELELEKDDYDFGVSITMLEDQAPTRLDFDHSD